MKKKSCKKSVIFSIIGGLLVVIGLIIVYSQSDKINKDAQQFHIFQLTNDESGAMGGSLLFLLGLIILLPSIISLLICKFRK
jgi:formate hydrogenlyase subunit 3/multisubunit Na+/H+ antiporter MnhD subunit